MVLHVFLPAASNFWQEVQINISYTLYLTAPLKITVEETLLGLHLLSVCIAIIILTEVAPLGLLIFWTSNGISVGKENMVHSLRG